MRLTVNGVEIPNPRDGIEAILELDQDPDEIGPVRFFIRGGSLTVRGNKEHPVGLFLTGEGRHPWLRLIGHQDPSEPFAAGDVVIHDPSVEPEVTAIVVDR